jgi:hypothetical protein
VKFTIPIIKSHQNKKDSMMNTLQSQNSTVYSPILKHGSFVRVKGDSEFRSGQDGMVVHADDGLSVGLVFGSDRYNQSPTDLGITFTGLTEEWMLDELDLNSILH